MIIDFRIRPPYKSFLDLSMYRPSPPPKDSRHVSPFTYDCGPVPSAEQRSIELLISEMDEAGISQAVVMGRQAGPKYGFVNNDDVAELGKLYPGRFHLFGGVALNDVPAAVAEVERVVGEMAFKGIAVDGGWSDPPVYIDDKRLYPIYEKCQQLGTILSLSMSIFLGPDLSYVEPIRLQHVAADFPDLLIVVPHGGWPYVMEFLGIAFMYRNVWLAPDFYVYIPGMPGVSHFVEAANFYLADRFLFASSYPERPLKQTVEEFKRLPLQPDVLEKALYQNAQWILGDRAG
jgi:predicted TIM-barrel fold metal-dependent hydrolase